MNQSQKKPSEITGCIRCGKCCAKGGPALHREDLTLVKGSAAVEWRNLITYRKGELVHDNVKGGLTCLEREFVKLRPAQEGPACIFYDSDLCGCSIYPSRPLECRVLKCWDTGKIEEVYCQERLVRQDIIQDSKTLLQIVGEHEKRCSHSGLRQITQSQDMNWEEKAQKIVDMLSTDKAVRDLVAQKAGLDLAVLDFIFGRPLFMTLFQYGLSCEFTGSGWKLKIASNP
ncbi:MAG: YkgJ family cysteine cluster protein [Desulfatibacillaceae bacterium]|nr:YkgJ family cysteine cluster protein [Desulfatibacillaceae bacterium]